MSDVYSMFLLRVENKNINRTAKILILTDSQDKARDIFNKSFIAQSGMEIVEVNELPDFVILDAII